LKIQYRIGKTIHDFTVSEEEILFHCGTGKALGKINKAEKHPCGCKLLTPRVAAIALLNKLVAKHGADELNRRLEA